jgi:hypothetical protein
MTDFSGPESLGGISDPRSSGFKAERRFVGRTIYERGPNGEVLSKVTDFSDGYGHYQAVLDREADLERRSRVVLYEGETAVDAHLRIQEARGHSVAPQLANVSIEQREDI